MAAAVSDEVDLIVLALAPTAYLPVDKLTGLLDRLNRSIDKPMAATGLVSRDAITVEGLPTFTFPEEAAQVLGRHAAYGRWRQERATAEPIGESRSTAEPMSTAEPTGGHPAGESVDRILADVDKRRLTLSDSDMAPLLAELNIPIAPFAVVSNEAEATAAAEQLGYPLALKTAGGSVRSVGESGGAAIDLHNTEALVAAYRRMSAGLGDAMDTAIVQPMVNSTGMVRIDLRQDSSYGSMISVGAGGSAIGDAPPIARRFLPLDDGLVAELVDALSAEATVVGLDTASGVDTASRAALADLITRVCQAATGLDSLLNLTLNPVLLAGTATVPVDIEVELGVATSNQLAGLRHLG